MYNWLRRNEPKIFLQDGEGSEKSLGKPGSLRGAGKRATMPGPSKPDALEIVEEDGQRYDPTISGLEPAKGKRKREDDGGYHPKSGAPGDGKAKKPRPLERRSRRVRERLRLLLRRARREGRGKSGIHPLRLRPLLILRTRFDLIVLLWRRIEEWAAGGLRR